MRFIEWPPLTRLCALLHNLDLGDRVVRGRLELLSTAAKAPIERDLREKIETELHSSPLFAAASPPPLLVSSLSAAAAAAAAADVWHGGSCSSSSNSNSSSSNSSRGRLRQHDPRQSTAKGKELLVNLISTLNQCFPDYEFR